jgi:hypothetical protein
MPLRSPTYVGGIRTGLEEVYYDWTRLIEELRRLNDRIDGLQTTVLNLIAQSQTNDYILEGSGVPSSQPLDVTKVWLYKNLDDGALYTWSVTEQAWI